MNEMVDTERLEDFLNSIADKWTAEEVVEILGLDVWDILEAFRDKVIEAQEKFEL